VFEDILKVIDVPSRYLLVDTKEKQEYFWIAGL